MSNLSAHIISALEEKSCFSSSRKIQWKRLHLMLSPVCIVKTMNDAPKIQVASSQIQTYSSSSFTTTLTLAEMFMTTTTTMYVRRRRRSNINWRIRFKILPRKKRKEDLNFLVFFLNTICLPGLSRRLFFRWERPWTGNKKLHLCSLSLKHTHTLSLSFSLKDRDFTSCLCFAASSWKGL